MPSIRNLEIGYPDSINTYITQDHAVRVATRLAEQLSGTVNVRIIPVECSGILYTALFSNFDNMQDAVTVARSGFMAFR